jgi:tRNA (mo5U34)-methyltransferase
MDLTPEKVGTFDLVLFLGVLYHMRYPLQALERVFSVTGEQLILETHVDLIGCKRPAMAFYPGKELGRDPTNWWGPNPAAVLGMLKTVGFRRVECVLDFSFLRRVIRAYKQAKRGGPFFRALQDGRMVVHAWR